MRHRIALGVDGDTDRTARVADRILSVVAVGADEVVHTKATIIIHTSAPQAFLASLWADGFELEADFRWINVSRF